MKRFARFATVLVTCLTSAIVTDAAQPPDPHRNAALLYWQAVALLPELTDEENVLLNKTSHERFATVELNDTSRELVQRSELALGMMRRGAQITQCDWGVPLEDGAAALMPHLGKARALVRLAVLQARHRLQIDQSPSGGAPQETKDDDLAAVEDLVAAIQLARHTGSDDIIISQLVQNSMEQLVFDVFSHHLFRLHPDAQRLLLSRLDEMPEPHGLDIAILHEKQLFITSLRAQFTGEQADREYLNLLNTLDQAQKDKFKKQAPDAAAVVRLLDDMAEKYDEAAQLAKLPPDEIGPGWEALIKRVQAENMIAKLFLPSVDRARPSDARAETRRAMLKAAVRVALDQEPQFKQIKDPFGEGAFERRDLKTGVALISQLTIDGKRFEATFD